MFVLLISGARDGRGVSVADTRYPLADTPQQQRIPARGYGFGCGWPLSPQILNPDDPLASEKFQALQTAFKILLDPIKRTEFDAKRATQAARTARFAGLDNKRKALARDLEAREEAKAAKIRKLEEINAAGAKLRQARMSELAAAIPTPSTQPAEPSPVQSTYPPAAPVETCNTLECTLRFKWTRKKLPDLNTVEDLST
ncbi:hypothetical protein PGT21_022526 [Puccinia graminis f. sp. tritici]|uniref:J domain-containing protein n=1 Tax=Puccinia graminis f. sp. tritici TaxID=56615 RepID=A0A5B0R1F6_PUCGR|nr:hypothetical protein PGT21_022526 [Puccinia graminis f. sp. tritici]